MRLYLSFLLFLFVCSGLYAQSVPERRKDTVFIEYTPGQPANSFIPSDALGATLDGHEQGDIDRIMKPANLRAMRSVGLRPLSYRLRTELGNEAWHWNPQGQWSDPKQEQGYWTSDDHASSPIQTCYGYNLPRRGNSHDQANDDGYSRIDDGDTTSYWKTNPYLDHYFTKESDSLHPQWLIVDLGSAKAVNTLFIQWADPYALAFRIDYAPDLVGYFNPEQPGLWQPVTQGIISNGKKQTSNQPIRFDTNPVKARFIRVLMFESSHTSSVPSQDVRDRAGFAVREIKVGYTDERGRFHDLVQHAGSNKTQTTIYVSSTDPWHRAKDIDHTTEQAGIDRFYQSGLPQGKPVLMPVALLFDTPENMTALLRYLRARHYACHELEMGEEPEGQLTTPNDYAALYCQWADAIKGVDPGFRMGGPGFAAISFEENDESTFNERTWTRIFLDYLRSHEHLQSFNFFTTEWYPFDDICAPTAPQLARQPQMLAVALHGFQKKILPPHTPIYLTEYGYSAYSGRPEADMEGALMYADIAGQFLTLGGQKAYLYGYEPAYLEQKNNCEWGNNMLFALDEDGRIKYRVAAYYGISMLTHYWAQPADSVLSLFPATSTILNAQQLPLVSAYALRRPDKKWSVLLINKDPEHRHDITIVVRNTRDRSVLALHLPLQQVQYSKKDYHWVSRGPASFPSISHPPEVMTVRSPTIALPPSSLTVLTEAF